VAPILGWDDTRVEQEVQQLLAEQPAVPGRAAWADR
jgi:hypothetical protein